MLSKSGSLWAVIRIDSCSGMVGKKTAASKLHCVDHHQERET